MDQGYYSVDLCNRIVHLSIDMSYSNTAIMEHLKKESVTVSLEGIRLVIKRYLDTGSVRHRTRSGRCKSYGSDIKTLIDDLMTQNQELTAPGLNKIIKQKTGVDVPESTIRRLRQDLGWVQCRTVFRPMIRLVNQEKRLEFCCELLRNNEKFEDVIFTDECTVQIEQNTTLSFKKVVRHQDDVTIELVPAPIGIRPKHPTKVHIWAGMY